MRKPRDYDAELKALDDKARKLKDRKLVQLGELVIATGADALPIEVLVGALIAAVSTSDAKASEDWRQRGMSFFQIKSHGTTESNCRNRQDAATGGGDPKPPADEASMR